jgi:hypothetical protein
VGATVRAGADVSRFSARLWEDGVLTGEGRARGGILPVVGLSIGLGGHAFANDCPGESATAIDVGANETVTLNPGGGVGDPMEEVLAVFTNGPDSEPATVTLCMVGENLHPDAPGYFTADGTLTVEVTFQDQVPDNEDTWIMRLMMPFDEADLPPGDEGYGPEATEVAYFRTSVWALAVAGNTADSPGFGGAIGDRTTVVGTVPPTEFSQEVGDHGAFWHVSELRGFAWANVDHAGDFAPGAPLCWSDITGDGTVDFADFVVVYNAFGQACVDPPVGCQGDIFFDGLIDTHDISQVLAFLGPEGCFLPPDVSDILHSVHQVDNGEGEVEWGPGTANSTYLTWDLRVAVDPEGIGNWWTTTEAFAQLTDPVYGALSFYQHWFDADWGAPPTAGVCYFYPAAKFDCYYIEATDVDPCTIGSSMPGAYYFDYIETDIELAGFWSDWDMFDPPTVGSPAFTIARYTILVDVDDEDCPDCHLDLAIVPSDAARVGPVLGTIAGVTTHRHGVSRLVPFSFDIIDRCPADIDGDGFVGIVDFLELLGAWAGGFGTPADLDRDGAVGILDFLMLLASWGPCS